MSLFLDMISYNMNAEIYKYITVLLFGSILKAYDDLNDLYMMKNSRLLACTQTTLIVILCYWLFVIAQTKYEIVMFAICFMGSLFDWEAFTSDPFFFASNTMFFALIMLLLYNRGDTFGMGELAIYIIIYMFLCVPISEFILFKYNGFFCEIGRYFHVFGSTKTCELRLPTGGLSEGKEEYLRFSNFSETEYEVGDYKLFSRSISILIYIFWIYLLHKCMIFYSKTTSDTNMIHAMQSLVYMITFGIGYMIVSIYNQVNVLYFHSELIEMHKKNNNEHSI